MKVAFFVNDVATEESEYTTTRLAMAASKLGHEVWYAGLGDVDYEPDEKLRARGHRAVYEDGDELETFLTRAQDDDREGGIVLDEFDAVWLRNDSIEDLHDRPWAMSVGVVFGQMLSVRGVTVVNDPVGLSRAASKLYLQEFPANIRPRCIVSRHSDEIKDFIARTGPTVVKPLYGAKGRNVFMIEDEDDPNLQQMIDAVLEDGYLTAQEFVPGAEDGDLRLFLLDGEPLRFDGSYAAFRRVPRGTDLRANISTGGRPVEASVGETEFEIARAMKDRLMQDGMFFVGIDIIGDKVVEIDAESPGGLQSVEHFTGLDFALPICQALERRALTHE
jgi:glutathione synthase